MIRKCALQLRRALIELIDNHDEALAAHYADGKLALESYKEYIEVFARSLKETMESPEGVSYLLRAVGFDVPPERSIFIPSCAGRQVQSSLARTDFVAEEPQRD